MTGADDGLAPRRSTRSRPAPTSSAGSASRPSRDEPLARFTTMRVGGPADLFAVVHNAFELRGARPVRARRARSRTSSSGGAATSSSRDARDPRPRHPGPGRGVARRRRPLPRRRRRPDGPGRDRDPGGRADRASSSGSRSRARSAARCGPTPAPTAPRRAGGPRVGDASCSRDGTERERAGRRARPRATATAGSRTQPRRPASPPRSSSARRSGSTPADPDVIKARLDDIRRWRQAHQPLGMPVGRLACSATPTATRRAG